MTFADFQLRVAELVDAIEQEADATGALTGKRTSPTDPHDKDRILRACNDGIEEFWGAADWSWSYTYRRLAISNEVNAQAIDDDTSRYLMADAQSLPEPPIYYTDGVNGGAEVDCVDMGEIIGWRATNPTTSGPPMKIAAYWNPEAGQKPSQRGQLEVGVYPLPDRDYTLTFSVKVAPLRIADITDAQRPQWPRVHDAAAIAFAARAYLRSDTDEENDGRMVIVNQMVGEKLAASLARDEDLRQKWRSAPDTHPARSPQAVICLDVDGSVLYSGEAA